MTGRDSADSEKLRNYPISLRQSARAAYGERVEDAHAAVTALPAAPRHPVKQLMP